MSKKSVQLKESGLNNFLLHHGEKVGLVSALFVAAMFLILGPSIDESTSKKSPDDLNTRIKVADTFIARMNKDTNHWKHDFLPDRQPPNDYPKRVLQQHEPTKVRFYSTLIPFDPPKMVPLTRRSDPELFPVVDIRAIPATVCLAYNPTDNLSDPTADDTDAKLEESKKRIRRKRRPRGGGGEDEGMEAGLDTESDMEAMEGLNDEGPGATTQWFYAAEKRRGYSPRPYVPNSNEDVFIAPGAADVIGVHRPMIAILALAPYKKQYEEFKRVFGSTVDYDRSRDKPSFLSFSAQRVDVTADPNRDIKENEWQPVKDSRNYVSREIPTWNGTATDLFTSADNFNRKIAMACPPIMMRDLKQFMWHPELPLRGRAATGRDPLAATAEAERQEAEENIPGLALARRKKEEDLNTGAGAGGNLTGGPDEAGMDEGMEAGMEGGMEMDGMGGYGGGSFMEEETPADYKLVRFYDFDVQPGHSYRYRIQLIFEDPNNPNVTKGRGDLLVHKKPQAHTLTDIVKERIRNLNDTKNLKIFRESPWSEPTSPILFPKPERVLVSVARQPKIRRSEKNHEFTLEEPQGTVKTIGWDKRRAVDVPIDRSVWRGSVLNFSGTYQYAHPFTHVVKNIDGFNTRTDWFVADIQGGEELPGSTKENPLFSPGEFAIIDAKGNLVIRNEIEDFDDFYRFTLAPKKEKTAASGSASGSADDTEDLTGMFEDDP